MEIRIAQSGGSAPSLIFDPTSGGEFASSVYTSAGVSLGPACNNGGMACASVVECSRPRFDRATIVNRMLDWSDEARAKGRVQRAEYLVCLAWDAYEQAPG